MFILFCEGTTDSKRPLTFLYILFQFWASKWNGFHQEATRAYSGGGGFGQKGD